MFTHIPPRLIWDIWMGAMMCRFLMWLATLVTSGFIRGGLVAQLTEKSRNVTAATFKWRLTSPQISNRDVWCLVSIKFGRYWHRSGGQVIISSDCRAPLPSHSDLPVFGVLCDLWLAQYYMYYSTIRVETLVHWRKFCICNGYKEIITKRTSCMILLCQSANEKVIDTRQSRNTI